MMCFGYWFLSNQQMFYNKAGTKRFDLEVIDPQHSYFTKGNHLIPVLIFVAVFIGKKPCSAAARYIAGKFSFIIGHEEANKMHGEQIIVNEKLDSYWRCLNGLD
jgi:hypothetical protein